MISTRRLEGMRLVRKRPGQARRRLQSRGDEEAGGRCRVRDGPGSFSIDSQESRMPVRRQG